MGLLIALVLLLAGLAAAAGISRAMGLWGTAAVSDAISIKYTTEKGENAAEGTVNSPLLATLTLPQTDSASLDPVANVSILFVDDAGHPAQFGGKGQEPSIMKPSFAIGSWTYSGSVPSVPGTL